MMKKGKDYILISELSSEEQEPFQKWLYGKDKPIIDDERIDPKDCCYKLDYEKWRAFHKTQEYSSECVQFDDAIKSDSIEGDAEMLMPNSDKKRGLNDLLKDVDQDNIHSETNTGDSIGKEDW
ncbi:hypothetical protein [Marinifilum sp.]|uniref:AbrB/MazE/SpoVT family DNA-binding domain-containing protein n=1 Tax=Marinifilum sp. TaxID=2033137 RepID=UPI003BAAF560